MITARSGGEPFPPLFGGGAYGFTRNMSRLFVFGAATAAVVLLNRWRRKRRNPIGLTIITVIIIIIIIIPVFFFFSPRDTRDQSEFRQKGVGYKK